MHHETLQSCNPILESWRTMRSGPATGWFGNTPIRLREMHRFNSTDTRACSAQDARRCDSIPTSKSTTLLSEPVWEPLKLIANQANLAIPSRWDGKCRRGHVEAQWRGSAAVRGSKASTGGFLEALYIVYGTLYLIYIYIYITTIIVIMYLFTYIYIYVCIKYPLQYIL